MPMLSVTVATQTPISYTLDGTSASFSLDSDFTRNPAFCPLTYTISVPATLQNPADPAVTVNGDGTLAV